MKRQVVIVHAWLNGLDLFIAAYPKSPWEKWSHVVESYLDGTKHHYIYFACLQIAWWE